MVLASGVKCGGGGVDMLVGDMVLGQGHMQIVGFGGRCNWGTALGWGV